MTLKVLHTGICTCTEIPIGAPHLWVEGDGPGSEVYPADHDGEDVQSLIMDYGDLSFDFL